MALTGLVDLYRQSRECKKMLEQHRLQRQQVLTGTSGSQKSLIISAYAQTGQTIIVVTYNQRQADRLAVELDSLINVPIHVFSAFELLPHEEAAHAIDLRASRLRALEALSGSGSIVICSVDAVSQAMMSKATFDAGCITLSYGSQIDLEGLICRLTQTGFERVEMVEGPGQFSIRGGIIDVFGLTMEHPLRIELFDDEIDCMRWFDLSTQTSIENVQEVQIVPAQDFFLPNDIETEVTLSIQRAADRQAKKLRDLGAEDGAVRLLEKTASNLEQIQSGVSFPGLEQYKPFFDEGLYSVLDYLPSDGLVILDEPLRIKEQNQQYLADMAEMVTQLLETGKVLPNYARVFLEWAQLWPKVQQGRVVVLSALDKRIAGMEQTQAYPIMIRQPEHFRGDLLSLTKKIKHWRREHYRLLIVAESADRGQQLADFLVSEDIPATYHEAIDNQLKIGNCIISAGNLESGFELPNLKLIVLTNFEVYGQRRVQPRVKRPEEGLRLSTAELAPGDYVVHVNSGIGRYLGVETLEVGGVHKDYLLIQYSGQDKLYVPTDQVDLLQRYVGADEGAPRLSKLGGGEWARVKKRVKDSVQDLAAGLIKLYAEREAVKGHQFSEDTLWQTEFEGAFPYKETPDQLQAIEEVKQDLRRARPMDRLLCGDVGYGKTEVAIRAAFKVVSEGKQVAVLVPTTILAQQHHRTFVERFENQPVRIGAISRFQSAVDQKKVLGDLGAGTLDIVIGTHRLLSKDIAFHDLGLVIVDEEQRFGVVQKERLKELCREVDVLTLSATPIPRTLHMAMVGVRDMSVIETPPEDRYPIRTYVVEHEDYILRQAIMRELDRNGQVYFVNNRIQTIDRMRQRLQDLVPEARIAVAHGRMDETILERVMVDFYQGEYDILLCTTIIETGMDIPNVNTLIVHDADQLGLAQLYQLRGRVGRTNRVAYAYFTYRRDKVLSEDAEKRLQAIKEFTDLGSGIKIAMRDLEIRGAGNLLGPEQHGFIASVGFEMYCRLLEEAIEEQKGSAPQKPPEPVLDLAVNAYIPEDYVGDSRQKVELYKRIIGIARPEDADGLLEEMEDRFGPVPEMVENLIETGKIKALARVGGIASIMKEKHYYVLRFLEGLRVKRERYEELVAKYGGAVGYKHGRAPQIRVAMRRKQDKEALVLLRDLLERLLKE